MNTKSNRRSFLKKSAAATLAAPLVLSLEEYALAQRSGASAPAAAPSSQATLPTGAIGKVKISRLICGGNLINGYAHSRDLVYVSSLLKHYFTQEKIMETWSLCEQHGINTMILHPGEAEGGVSIYQKYRASGGRIQYLAQISPTKEDLKTEVHRARDAGAAGIFLVGNLGDAWTRDGDVELIGQLVSMIKAQGLIAGVAGHDLRTVKAIEKAGIAPDFYMKTLHDTNYWSKRRPDQLKDVIDNNADNYWCMDPKETIAFMDGVERPWIAYKVLAAGAIAPRAAFQHAFENGADFVAAGMFDFQIAEDVEVANAVLKTAHNRERVWYG